MDCGSHSLFHLAFLSRLSFESGAFLRFRVGIQSYWRRRSRRGRRRRRRELGGKHSNGFTCAQVEFSTFRVPTTRRQYAEITVKWLSMDTEVENAKGLNITRISISCCASAVHSTLSKLSIMSLVSHLAVIRANRVPTIAGRWCQTRRSNELFIRVSGKSQANFPCRTSSFPSHTVQEKLQFLNTLEKCVT